MDAIFSLERPFDTWNIRGFAGKPAYLFENLNSTHRYSKENLQNLEAGDAIVANSQSNGRGRHERVWISPAEKNIYFNILYSLDGFETQHYPQLMQITAISIAQVFREIGVNASVKWPNDILCEKKKVCGMISEILIKNGKKLLTTGIGIDVNANESDFKDINRPVTSLKLLLGKTLNREILLQKIIQQLEKAVELTRRTGLSPWIEEWRKMDQFIGHSAKMLEGNEIIEGTILDINNDGSLLFCQSNGQIIKRYTGDLEI